MSASDQEDIDQARKRPKLDHGKDEFYFKSYANLQIHEDMIRDFARTDAYRQAIMKHKDQLVGKVVLDLGAGSGILSIFCAQAGARKVYAVEASSMAKHAREVVKSNGFDNIIEVLNCRVEDAQISHEVDVIVSEWMGYFLLYESMFESVIYARDRWLRSDGLMLPSRAILRICGIADSDFEREHIDFWSSTKDTYGVDMTALIPFARECMLQDVHIEWLPRECILTRDAVVKDIDCYTITVDELRHTECEFALLCMGDGIHNGIGAWFDTEFSQRNANSPTVTLTTSPFATPTHWNQTIFYIDKPINVKLDDQVRGRIKIDANTAYSRFIDVRLTIDQIHDTASQEKNYVLRDN